MIKTGAINHVSRIIRRRARVLSNQFIQGRENVLLDVEVNKSSLIYSVKSTPALSLDSDISKLKNCPKPPKHEEYHSTNLYLITLPPRKALVEVTSRSSPSIAYKNIPSRTTFTPRDPRIDSSSLSTTPLSSVAR